MQGYVWRHGGYETKLEASLHLFDKTTRHMETLAGTKLDGATLSMTGSPSGNLVPAGAMHAHRVRPSGSVHGDRMSANQRGHGPPRSTPGHARNLTPGNPCLPSSDLMPQFPGFGSPMADSSINSSTIPAWQLSPVDAGTDPYQRFLGQAPPYLYNSPETASTSRSSSISTMSNTHLASCGSSYAMLTEDGKMSIPGSPYASHNVSTSTTEFSPAYPPTPSSPLSPSEPVGTSQGTERDMGYKIIIRRVLPGATAEQLSVHIDEMMPWQYVQHNKPMRGEDDKWSVTFLNEEVAMSAVERLDEVEFQGNRLQVIPDTRSAARRRMGSSGSSSDASSSSTARGPAIVDGSLPG